MKKKLIRMVSLVVCVLMISACFPVYAQSSSNEDFSIQPRWTELSTYQCSLTSHSGLFSNAKVASTASTHSAMAHILTLLIHGHLQVRVLQVLKKI